MYRFYRSVWDLTLFININCLAEPWVRHIFPLISTHMRERRLGITGRDNPKANQRYLGKILTDQLNMAQGWTCFTAGLEINYLNCEITILIGSWNYNLRIYGELFSYAFVYMTKVIRCCCESSNSGSTVLILINSLWPSVAIWWHRAGSTLAHVMACCLMSPSHYLNLCWLICKVLWHSSEVITVS